MRSRMNPADIKKNHTIKMLSRKKCKKMAKHDTIGSSRQLNFICFPALYNRRKVGTGHDMAHTDVYIQEIKLLILDIYVDKIEF